MILSKIFKNTLLLLAACLVLSACATKKEVTTSTDIQQMQGDVYTGTDTVEYLADGVPDRVFFATNESILTTASRETLRAQAAWLRKNSSINVVIERHADERGTREYNLALGERRANSAKITLWLMEFLQTEYRYLVMVRKTSDGGSSPLAGQKIEDR